MADKARIQATELLNSKRTKINTEFTTFSQGLASLKETENYVEHELTELNEKIAQFKLDLEDTVRPAAIKVHTELSETIDWENMIYVDQEQTLAKTQQQRQYDQLEQRYNQLQEQKNQFEQQYNQLQQQYNQLQQQKNQCEKQKDQLQQQYNQLQQQKNQFEQQKDQLQQQYNQLQQKAISKLIIKFTWKKFHYLY